MPLLLLSCFGQRKRIVRPSVLDILFRASSFRTRCALCTERKRCIPVVRGTFASSTKYLRQSSWPYIAAYYTQSTFTHQISFFLQQDISRCLSDHFACCLYCRFFFRLSRRFHFAEKKSKTVEVSSSSSLLHDSSSSHGQPLEKQYFNISRLPLTAATVIVFHPTRTVSLLSPT